MLGMPHRAARLALAASLLPSVAAAQLAGLPEKADRFGAALVSGDFDGDGFTDLAIGVPGDRVKAWTLGGATYTPSAGSVHVLYGRPGGLTSAHSDFLHQGAESPGVLGIGSNHQFGAALAAGDFDADGLDDLAIGIPGQHIGSLKGAGAVMVLHGTPHGLAGPTYWTQDSAWVPDQAEAGDAFGSALAVGDVDGDGFDDLGIGAPGEDLTLAPDTGGALVLRGSPYGLHGKTSTWLTQGSTHQFPWQKGDRFGAALAFGDLDADGRDETVIGVPGDEAGAGMVQVFPGSIKGPSPIGATGWHQDLPDVEGDREPLDGFGSALAIADLDVDGVDDLAVGIPLESSNGVRGGGVHLFLGTAAGVTAAGDMIVVQDDPAVIDAGEAGDRFGSVLATFVIEGFQALMIGVPGEEVDGVPQAGAFEAITLSPPFGVGWCWFNWGIPAPSAGAAFGSAIATGDFDGDGDADYASGAPLWDYWGGGPADCGSVQVQYAGAPFNWNFWIQGS